MWIIPDIDSVLLRFKFYLIRFYRLPWKWHVPERIEVKLQIGLYLWNFNVCFTNKSIEKHRDYLLDSGSYFFELILIKYI